MGDTKIEWADRVWNPVRGCSRISPGCGGANHQGGCYAEKIAARFSDPGQAYHGLAVRTPHGGRWTGEVRLIESQLEVPWHWIKPQRIFVNSMSDLFHESLDFKTIAQVIDSTRCAPHHIYMILTKRSAIMREFCEWWCRQHAESRLPSHIWMGVSVEDRERKFRIADLQNTPAATKFISFEPLLEDVGELDLTGIHQAITGGESGPRKRPHDVEWQRSILRQCRSQGVAFFGKQDDKVRPLPDDLMIREFPVTA